MHIIDLALNSAWKVLLVALVLGAGIPAIFALGVRGVATASGDMVEPTAPRPMGRVVAGVCFALVAIAIAFGLAIIISSGFGMKVSFEHVYPTFVDKK